MGRVDPAQYFWSGATPCGRGRPPPGLILLVKPKFQVVAPNGLARIFSYILVKALMGNFQFRTRLAPNGRFMNKIGPKNGLILTKIGIHIEQTSDYYHAKFYIKSDNIEG